MTDQPTPAELHEQFVKENREIDLAWQGGKLTEWLERKLADELDLAESEN